MENIRINGDLSKRISLSLQITHIIILNYYVDIENFIKLSYKQQLELVTEQEKQRLNLYGDYIINCIPLNIRKLKIREILEDQGKNIILSEDEKTEILNKLSEIVSLKSFKSESMLESSSPELKNVGLYKDHLKKSRVKLLPISNTCYTIIREKTEDFCQSECDEKMENNNYNEQIQRDKNKDTLKNQILDSNVVRDIISSL
ncbi:uncharacterized protein cubi_00889 [Cryptosporidium ubiquitum]|uniref:Uncharacterized protein n=1 Tax=Cryptosporidium ubiquitum TaxID=857276 RepID=A0A1J4M941_9CRYT|nr:uncharacterized protein cubi_00889 [Cryptosporidium ubiquitum]OII70744.1 hypothetical protein cubi_00889 [Cryptosporidium ubiquitum]